MKKNIYPILFFISLMFFSCSSENDDNNQDRVEEKLVLNQNEKMEAVYYSIPSPMETTIILKRNYPKFSANLLFPDINIHEIHDNQIIALILGIISTDLNYAMLSERKLETNRLINKVIEVAQILHLDGVVNSSIKDRIEKNLNNKDSMQIIIGNTFWEIENKLKEDHKEELSALIVAGGWIEGLYLATNMANMDSSNKPLQNIIADQKIVHENLIELISDFTFEDLIQENLVSELINMKAIFQKISVVEIERNSSIKTEKNDEMVIGNYFNLKFEKEDLKDIHNLISNLRQTILNHLL